MATAKKQMKKKKTLRFVFGYPPIPSKKGVPLLSQNRQFQYFNAKTYIYPMVPAYAASNVQAHGYPTAWMDGIAAEQTMDEWLAELKAFKPDVLMIETKSPVVKKHWKAVDDIKKKFPKLKVVLVGDHISFMPEETMENCSVDYVITGGDYDFVIVNILDHLSEGAELESGVWWRAGDKSIKFKNATKVKGKGGQVFYNSGPASLKHNLNDLPFMYSGRDCWWNRCTFCVWDHTINPLGSYRRFSPERLFAEVKHVVDNYGVKEIFDDAGTFMIGKPLRDFCQMMIDSGYNKKVVFGCNMRLNAVKQADYDIMGKANFRFILYGMESGNQKTLDKLDKGVKVEQIKEGVRMAKKGGLDPHLTIMLGYPWEDYADAERTINLAKECFDAGYVDTLQATITIPYPGTPLWKECREKGWLLTEDYEDYDMRRPVMKTGLTEEDILKLTQKLYSSFLTPKFMLRKVTEIRNWDDIKYLATAGWRFIGHLKDFSPKQLRTAEVAA
jgi:anaerobic magnesium-protoporphyrin IX monomethyl ester cyclase